YSQRRADPFTGYAGSTDQGLRELLALAGILEAYRRISGTATLSEASKDEAERKLVASVSGDVAGKELIAPLVSLLAGGLAGTGVDRKSTRLNSSHRTIS